MQPNLVKQAYSIGDVSERTSLSKSFIRNEIRSGNLRARRFGRRVLVLSADLDAYLQKGNDDDLIQREN